MIELHLGDCLDILPTMDAGSIDTCITDCPYGLQFMGKDWDHGVPGIPFWQAVHRVLKPGAMLLAFGGTRTHHRLMCAIEDAGFEIRDVIMYIYGSGFPKSHNISKAIDAKILRGGSNSRRLKETNEKDREFIANRSGDSRNNGILGENKQGRPPITAPATEAAALWDGYGTALKPAYEPIIVAMKPIEGTFANNALTHGVAGLWVDGGRVGTDEVKTDQPYYYKGDNGNSMGAASERLRTNGSGTSHPSGRFPANLIHDGSDEVLEGFPSPHGVGKARLSSDGTHSGSPSEIFGGIGSPAMRFGDTGSAARFFMCCPQDNEDLSLLLLRAKAIIEVWKPKLANTVDDNSSLSKEHAASVLSHAVTEVSQGDKQLSVLTGLSTNVTPKLLNYLCESVIIATLNLDQNVSHASKLIAVIKSNGNLARYAEIQKQTDITTITANQTILDGFAVAVMLTTTKKNTDHGEADYPSRIKYCAKASRTERNAGLEGMEAQKRDESRNADQPSMNGGNGNPYNRGAKPVTNHHPTVKPLALMRYLAKLTRTPTGGIVLDPFMGSGTTGMGAVMERRDFIGIELKADYLEIAERRIEWAKAQKEQLKMEI